MVDGVTNWSASNHCSSSSASSGRVCSNLEAIWHTRNRTALSLQSCSSVMYFTNELSSVESYLPNAVEWDP